MQFIKLYYAYSVERLRLKCTVDHEPRVVYITQGPGEEALELIEYGRIRLNGNRDGMAYLAQRLSKFLLSSEYESLQITLTEENVLEKGSSKIVFMYDPSCDEEQTKQTSS